MYLEGPLCPDPIDVLQKTSVEVHVWFKKEAEKGGSCQSRSVGGLEAREVVEQEWQWALISSSIRRPFRYASPFSDIIQLMLCCARCDRYLVQLYCTSTGQV